MRGYRIAPGVWGTGLTVAVGAGWLRIAADKHYATDVLVGMLAGSAVGVALPLLFHGPVADDARGDAVALRWSWSRARRRTRVPGRRLLAGAPRAGPGQPPALACRPPTVRRASIAVGKREEHTLRAGPQERKLS